MKPIIIITSVIVTASSAFADKNLCDATRLKRPGIGNHPVYSVALSDTHRSMDPLYGKLAELARGGDKAKGIRIAFFGDSNHTMDVAASELRTQLGRRFGFGGHGFIAAARPWNWYQHAEINVSPQKGWRSYAITKPRRRGFKGYGLASIIGYGRGRRASISFKRGRKGHEENRVFGETQLHYRCQKAGGDLSVWAAKQKLSEIKTKCDEEGWKTQDITVPKESKRISLKVDRGHVIVYGMSFELEKPGVVIDNLSASSLNSWYLARLDDRVFQQGLRARKYDLVIVHLGTNMWSGKQHRKSSLTLIQRLRQALGDTLSIILVSPGDAGQPKDKNGFSRRMARCAKEKRLIAKNNRVAFWDYYRAMGGRGSVMKWRAKRAISADLIHPRSSMNRIMWRAFTGEFLAGFRDYLRRTKICP
jgi:hypothetical protein